MDSMASLSSALEDDAPVAKIDLPSFEIDVMEHVSSLHTRDMTNFVVDGDELLKQVVDALSLDWSDTSKFIHLAMCAQQNLEALPQLKASDVLGAKRSSEDSDEEWSSEDEDAGSEDDEDEKALFSSLNPKYQVVFMHLKAFMWDTEVKLKARSNFIRQLSQLGLHNPSSTFVVSEMEPLRPRFMRVLSGWGETEYFVIDGDSLVLEAMKASRLDWSNGGQFMHAFYIIEGLLNSLLEQGAKFHVMFMDEHKHMWKEPSKLLLREILRRMLKQSLPRPDWVFATIPSYFHPKWNDFMRKFQPTFILISDAFSELDEVSGRYWQSVCSFLNSCGRTLAFLSGHTIAERVMSATVVESFSVHHVHRFMVKKFAEENDLEDLELVETLGDQSDDGIEALESVFPESTDGAIDGNQWHMVASTLAAAYAAKQCNTDINSAAKAAILFSCLKEDIPLEERSVRLSSNSDALEAAASSEFFAQWACSMLELLPLKGKLDTRPLVDTMDGRFVRGVVGAVAAAGAALTESGVTMPDAKLQNANKLWELAVSKSDGKLKGSLFPLEAPAAAADAVVLNSTNPEPTTGRRNVALQSTPLFEEICNMVTSEQYSIESDKQVIQAYRSMLQPFGQLGEWSSSCELGLVYKDTLAIANKKKEFNLDHLSAKRRDQIERRQQQIQAKFQRNTAEQFGLKQSTLMGSLVSLTSTETRSLRKLAGIKSSGPILKEEKENQNWKELTEKFEQEDTSFPGRLDLVDKRFERVRDQIPMLALEILLYRLHCNVQDWKAKRKDADYRPAVEAISTLRIIVGEFEKQLKFVPASASVAAGPFKKKNKKKSSKKKKHDDDDDEVEKNTAYYGRRAVVQTLVQFGFEKEAREYAKTVCSDPHMNSDIDNIVDKYRKKYSVHCSSLVDFQLKHMGHLLFKSSNASVDERVPDFIPDNWQRDLLNVIDRQGSALVCAPTSAGKTFSSYYVMQQVLKEKDGRVIYVAPTKALIDEVFSRVDSFAPNQVGWLQRNYVNNFEDCRVLVTSPECCEELLLSPLESDWVSSVKYVVLDEVHCLSTDTNGAIWERVIQALKCPFLALSATVGNPESFTNWINCLRPQGDVELVHYGQRYVDLRQYLYTPPDHLKSTNSIIENAQLNQRSVKDHCAIDNGKRNCLRRMHPVVHITPMAFQEGKMPPNVRLEPLDCLQLWEAMVKVVTDEDAEEEVEELQDKVVKDLSPATNFKSTLFLNRWDVVEWERKLTGELMRWAASGDEDLYQAAVDVVVSLGNVLLLSVREMEKQQLVSAQRAFEITQNAGSNSNAQISAIGPHLVNSLCALHEQDRLPAIVFNFERENVELLAREVLLALEQAEQAYCEKNRKGMRASEKDAKAQDLKMKKQMDDAVKAGKKAAEHLQEKLDQMASDGAFGQQDAYMDNYTFLPDSQRRSKSFADAVAALEKSCHFGKSHFLVRCLQRGIGIHHPGMPRKYITTIQDLFRSGVLRVVFSTETLAYGINMPARSAVFAGDSVLLTAVQFQQMAGRAGRRGLDVLGHVVFVGIPLYKLHRLAVAPVPQLSGNAIDIQNTVPRLLHLMNMNPTYGEEFANRVLTQPLLQFDGQKPAYDHLWQSVALGDFLLLTKLINNDGELSLPGRFVAYMFVASPAQYAFAALLQSGVLKDIAHPDIPWSQKSRDLITIFGSLFNRLPIHPTLAESAKAKQLLADRNEVRGQIVMPAMPEKARAVIDQLNNLGLHTFSNHAAAARARVDVQSMDTPLSGNERSVRSSNGVDVSGMIGDAVKPSKLMDPFVALSGRVDEFESVDDLIGHSHPSLRLADSKIIPQMQLEFTDGMLLNAAYLDFFVHGSGELLEEENGIHRSRVWNLLHEFVSTLKCLDFGLARMLNIDPTEKNAARLDCLANAVHKLHEEYEQKLDNWTAKHSKTRME